MTDIDLGILTGSGIVDTGVNVGWTEVFYEITTYAPFADLLSPLSPVPRVYKIGWYGLGYPAGGSYPNYVSFGNYIKYTAEFLENPGLYLCYATHFLWDLQPGNSVHFIVSY